MKQSLSVKKRAENIRERIMNDPYDTGADIIDALANLRHLCDRAGLEYAKLDHAAYQHYLIERAMP